MGENISEKKFTIKDDGTIVRGKKCPKCGIELISEGDYCEYCGAKIEGTTLTSTPKKGGSKGGLWLFIVAIIIVAAIIIITPFTTSNNNYYYDWSEPTAIEEAVEYDEDEEDYSEEVVSYDEDEEYYQEKAVSYDEEPVAIPHYGDVYIEKEGVAL